MNNNCLDKLEFKKILEILSKFAKTYAGKKLIKDLTPSFDAIQVANLQLQTSGAVDMINKYGNPPIGEFNDVSIHLKKLSGDSILSAKEILDLANDCLNCKVKPCSMKGCPIKTNIPEFINIKCLI